jgi:hypothetical protein
MKTMAVAPDTAEDGLNPAPVAALRSEDLLSADGPSAAFFDVLYAPPSEFLVVHARRSRFENGRRAACARLAHRQQEPI